MISLAIFAFLSMTSTHPHPSISELNTVPDKYDGKKVTVTGWVVIGPESRYIVAQKTGYTLWKKGATCLSVINGGGLDAREDEFNGKQVRLTGLIRANADEDGEVRLGMCSGTALDLENEPIEGKIEIVR